MRSKRGVISKDLKKMGIGWDDGTGGNGGQEKLVDSTPDEPGTRIKKLAEASLVYCTY